MTDTHTTARDNIRIPIGLAFVTLNRPMSEVDELLDEYEAAHRAETLTEVIDTLHRLWRLAPESGRAAGINFVIGALTAMRDNPAVRATTAQEG